VPNFIDAFPQNYSVTNNPLHQLNMNPMQYISGVLSPWGGTLADPLGNLLDLFISAVDADINLLNQLIESIIPWAPMIPNLEQLIGALGSAFGQNGVLCGLMQGIPLIELIFGTVGSEIGLFWQSALFAVGGFFSGLDSTPLIQQINKLISGATILASQIIGDLSVLITVGGRELGALLSQIDSTGNYIGSLALSQITGIAAEAESWLTSGVIPSVTTIVHTAVTDWDAATSAAISAASIALSQITGIAAAAESWLTSGEIPSVTTIVHTAVTDWDAATSAAISAASIALSQITGLETGIESWLASGGALPTGTTVAHTAITDWDAATATAISAASIALSQITGLATGIESWLTSGGALPSGFSVPGAQLIGSVSGGLISGPTTIEQGIVDGIGQASQGAQSFVQQAVTDYNSAVATVQNLVSPITSIVSIIPNLW